MRNGVAMACILGLILSVPSFSMDTIVGGLEVLQEHDLAVAVGGFGLPWKGGKCIGIILGLSLGLLAGAVASAGVGLALAGAYLPIAVAAC